MVREALTEKLLASLSPQEAAACFLARRAEGFNHNEDRLFADWLAQDAAHRAGFESAEKAWQAFDGGEDDEIIAAMRAHAVAKPRTNVWRPLGAGAAALLAACVAIIFIVPSLNPWAPENHPVTYASQRGEVMEINLPDGTHMTLDAESSVTTRFGARRSLTLERGRAYFVVAHNTQRPFAVTAGGHNITDVGTRFDANLTADGVVVTLLEGRVDVATTAPAASMTHPLRLIPGQQFVAHGAHAEVREIGGAAENAIAWRTGLINFDNQPLGDAAAVMNRYTAQQISITDPTIAAIRVSGQFHAGDTRRFAETLSEMHNLRMSGGAADITLSRP